MSRQSSVFTTQFCSYLAVALVLCCALPGYADRDVAVEDECALDDRCMEHDAAGTNAFLARQYSTALREYKTAFEIRQAPRLLMNIGRTQHYLGKYDAALATYRQHEKRLPLPDKETAKQRLRFIKEAEEARSAQDAARQALTPTDTATQPAGKPIYKRWQFWTGLSVGVVALGAAVAGITYAATHPPFSKTEPY